MQITTEEAIAKLEDTPGEAYEMGADALAFVKGIHEVFKELGMTSREEPNLAELENLFDAMHCELAAAALFLCEPSFARVPDMLRAISVGLSNSEHVPPEVAKGFERLAKRIENTRVKKQAIIGNMTKVLDES